MARHESKALWAFASGELEPTEQTRVADHVAGCEECARELSKVRQAQALLRAVQDDAPAVRWDETDDQIQSAAARRLARLERAPQGTWAFAAVGVVVAAVLAFVVLRPTAPQHPPSALVAIGEDLPSAGEPAPREQPTPAPGSSSSPVIATQVESASGAWIREAEVAEHSLQAGSPLHSGASVRTRGKASAVLRLPDTSRVRLSPDSEVTLTRTEAQDVHLTVTKGRLAVQASHEARRGFTVETAGVSASVVGTVFSVERTKHGAVVAVLEGKVRVDTEGQPPRFVTAGERLEVNSGEQAAKARALSAQDRQAFQELKREPSTGPSATRAPAPVVTPASEGVPKKAVPTEPAAPASPTLEKSPVAESGSESPPYPVPSPEPEKEMVLAPWTSAPDARAETEESQPNTSAAGFLSHAQEQLGATTCESFLVGLAEIAQGSRVREYREQARYLRARCFEERLAKAAAEAEFRRYLREFPKGRYVREAKAALLP